MESVLIKVNKGNFSTCKRLEAEIYQQGILAHKNGKFIHDNPYNDVKKHNIWTNAYIYERDYKKYFI